MFVRLVYESFRRQRRRKLLAGAAVTLGIAVATAMIAVASGVGDKISRELRAYGANLLVYPDTHALGVDIAGVNLKPAGANAYLRESDLPAIKGIFWRNNILGFAPMLPVTVRVGPQQLPAQLIGTYFHKQLSFGRDTFVAGVEITHPWWKVAGAWPKETATEPVSEALAGAKLAKQLGVKAGDQIQVAGRRLTISGILSAAGSEDNAIVAPLPLAQDMLRQPGAVAQVYVSAITKPEDEFARRDPRTMSPEMRDRWYCSPYANSIAFQLQEAIPHARAEQIRQVAQNEGRVLSRIQGLMLLMAIAALLAAGLAVSAAMATAIFERRAEVGLMKALGAGNFSVAALFFTEAGLLALIGGTVGFLIGIALAEEIGKWVFSARVAVEPVLFPVVLAVAVLVTFAGSAASIRRAMQFSPAIVLRGDA